MIIKGQKNNSLGISFKWLAILILVIVGIYGLSTIDLSKNPAKSEIIFCGAETVNGSNFSNGDFLFSNSKTQSSEQSYSGRFSSKVDGENKYGVGFTIKNPLKDVRYIASVKRYTSFPKKSALVIKGSPGKDIYYQTNLGQSTNKEGWELLTLDITILDSMDVKELSIFTYSTSTTSDAYFDDFQIEIVKNEDNGLQNLDKLHLYFDNKSMRKINKKREEAIQKGLLQSSDDDWVNAKLTENDSLSTDVKIRLKGDWTDHLTGDYWSYRVKMPSDKSWERMQVFSIQDPSTRYYLFEWLFHKALEKADVITPRYGFVNFSQNNQEPVLYAYEEHFDKQIVEYKNRREGVIVKFSEEFLWNQRLRNKDIEGTDVHQNVIHNADILPFKAGRTFKDPKLTEQFLRAQDLMDAFRNKTVPASEVFDMQLLANYFAITDVLNANHGAIWHNLRFYYNPVTRKLEPIGFDGFTPDGHFRMYVKLFFGEFMSSEDETEYNAFYKYIFQDEEFIRYYVPAMVNFSSDTFISSLLKEHDAELNSLETLIRRNAKQDYDFDDEVIRKRAKKVHKNIQPFDENSMKVFREKNKDGSQQSYVSNYHNLPLEVVGFGSSKEWNASEEEMNLIIRSNGRKVAPTYAQVEIPSNASYLFYRLPGQDDIFYTTIKDWHRPQKLTIDYSANDKLSIPFDKREYELKDKVVNVLAGAHTLNKPLILPKGYTLAIEEGTTLDIIKSAYILVNGPVFIKGSKEDPVIINSSDKTAQGVAVIQANEKSIVNNVSFRNLNTLEEKEWQLTGAVTFYESDVEMTNVTITKNLCEDALNIIRSNFTIKELNINNTFADGFDSDFCTGKLFDSYFHHTGNDGIDYSGSYVNIENVRLENIGDKGISAGEEATLIVKDVTIDNAIIGIASKDLSKVDASGLQLKNCVQGFAAYRKKPEFGGGRINVSSYTVENVETLKLEDEESKIKLPK